MMVYEDTAERHRFDSFCKVVLRMQCWTVFGNFHIKTNGWYFELFAAADYGRNLYDRSVP